MMYNKIEYIKNQECREHVRKNATINDNFGFKSSFIREHDANSDMILEVYIPIFKAKGQFKIDKMNEIYSKHKEGI